jgi:hypothetical protein
VRCRAGGENQRAASLQHFVSFEGWVWYKAIGIAISANRFLASMVSIEEDSARMPMRFQPNQYSQIKIRVV